MIVDTPSRGGRLQRDLQDAACQLVTATMTARLYTTLTGVTVGTNSVEAKAMSLVEERVNKEGVKSKVYSRKGGGYKFVNQVGCHRDPRKVKALLTIKLEDSRKHELEMRRNKLDRLFDLRKSNLTKEEKATAEQKCQAKIDKLNIKMNKKLVEKITHLRDKAEDCTKHTVCARINKKVREREKASSNFRNPCDAKPCLDPDPDPSSAPTPSSPGLTGSSSPPPRGPALMPPGRETQWWTRRWAMSSARSE